MCFASPSKPCLSTILSFLLITNCINLCHGFENFRPEYLGKNKIPIATRDLYCGAYVVWHVLNYYGMQTTIDDIKRDMAIDKQKGCSIAELILTLNKYGIKAHGCRMDVDSIGKRRAPFVPYLSTNGNSGHFVLCVPQNHGYVTIFDGAIEPRYIKLKHLENENFRKGWDGVTVLIEGLNSNSGLNTICFEMKKELIVVCAVFIFFAFIATDLWRKIRQG